jgi:poly(3-hydroxybutyrate) depolymerase
MVSLICCHGKGDEQVSLPPTPKVPSSVAKDTDWPPLLDQSNPFPKSLDGRIIERFTHGSRSQWGYKTSQKNYFFLVHPKKNTINAPLCVVLHSANRTALDYLGYCFLNRKVDPGDNPGDFGEKVPDGFYALFLDSNNDEWWGWASARSDVREYATKQTPAEHRALDTIDWVARVYHINRNRIYLTGVSMGGCGSLGIGMPHGDIFAAVRVWVPAGTEYVSCRLGYDPSPSGETLRDGRTNFLGKADLPDPPPVIDLSASNDPWSKDQGALQEIALDRHFPLMIGWGPFGHTGAFSPVAKYSSCAAVLALPWMEICKNEAYPVFTHASTDQCPPWNHASGKADESGQINGFFRWKSIMDKKSEFAMQLWLAHLPADKVDATTPNQSMADITLRRLQKFEAVCDRTYEWKLIRGNKLMTSGTVRPDAAGLITIPNVIVTTDPLRLQIATSSGSSYLW